MKKYMHLNYFVHQKKYKKYLSLQTNIKKHILDIYQY